MSFSLSSHEDNFELNNYWFHEILKLAYENGWKPMGTKGAVFYNKDGTIWQDFRKGWEGGYFTNDFQEVTVKDAKNIAKALKRAKRLKKAQKIAFLDDFIAFCEKGSFTLG